MAKQLPTATALLQGMYSMTAVVPSDSADQFSAAAPSEALYFGADGTAKLTFAGDAAAVTVPVSAGLNRMRVARVWATPTPPSVWHARVGG